jgi:hypothetical protein
MPERISYYALFSELISKSPLVQQALAGITVIFMLGALSMIWPVIMTFFIGLLWLLQSYSA